MTHSDPHESKLKQHVDDEWEDRDYNGLFVFPLDDKHYVSPYVRILICGSRFWTDEDAIREVLEGLVEEFRGLEIQIIHGDCRGADRIAARIAKEDLGIENVQPYPAKWKKYGDAAGPIRNQEMISLDPTHMVAFGSGYGTEGCVRLAQEHGDIDIRRYGTT